MPSWCCDKWRKKYADKPVLRAASVVTPWKHISPLSRDRGASVGCPSSLNDVRRLQYLDRLVSAGAQFLLASGREAGLRSHRLAPLRDAIGGSSAGNGCKN